MDMKYTKEFRIFIFTIINKIALVFKLINAILQENIPDIIIYAIIVLFLFVSTLIQAKYLKRESNEEQILRIDEITSI
jgi:putative effector of murein hydrolase LrgA (UPF0299 family)